MKIIVLCMAISFFYLCAVSLAWSKQPAVVIIANHPIDEVYPYDQWAAGVMPDILNVN